MLHFYSSAWSQAVLEVGREVPPGQHSDATVVAAATDTVVANYIVPVMERLSLQH
jgi:hypothetical protein